MSERREPHEAELQALFDATAEGLSGPALTRMAARSADVPARAERIPRFLPRWAWAPTFAGLSVALGAMAALLLTQPMGSDARSVVSVPESASALEESRGAAPPDAAAVSSTVRAVGPALPTEPAGPLPTLGLFDDALGASDFEIGAAPAEPDLDAWLTAVRQLTAER